MAFLAVLLALAFCFGSSACGGSGDQASGPEPAPAVSEPSADTAPRDEAAELQSYLNAVKATQDDYLKARDRGLALFDRLAEQVDQADDAQWLRSNASRLKDVRDHYDEVAISVARIDAPEELREAHASLAKSVQLFSLMNEELAEMFQRFAGIVAKPGSTTVADVNSLGGEIIDTVNSYGNRALEARVEWRVAVSAAAADAGIAMPAWAKEVGKRP